MSVESHTDYILFVRSHFITDVSSSKTAKATDQHQKKEDEKTHFGFFNALKINFSLAMRVIDTFYRHRVV